MKVSIVTTFYNAESTIQETIDSIVCQNYENIEVIFVDGDSTDRSLEVVKSNLPLIPSYKIISEEDKGIYDGMNKGVRLATGEIICILNADDCLTPNAINIVVGLFDDGVDIVAGTINKFDKKFDDGVITKRSDMSPLSAMNPSVHHPAVFVRKKVYDTYGLFDLTYKISADFDFIGRVVNAGANVKYTDMVLVNMRSGGISDSLRFHFLKNLEHLKIGYKNRTSLPNFFKYNMYVFKKFLYGILVFLNLK